MIRFSFRKGLAFLDRAMGRWSLEKQTFNHKYRLEKADGESVDLTREELLERWREGQWVIDPECLGERSDVFFTATPGDIRSLADKDQAVVRGRLDYIFEVKRLFKEAGQEVVSTVNALKLHIENAADTLRKKWIEKVEKGDKLAATTLQKVAAPSAATFWRWWSRYSPTRCPLKLADRRGRASSGTRLQEQYGVFEEACLEVFLTIQRKPGKAVCEAVRRKYKAINAKAAEAGVPAEQWAKPPSRATIYRWLKELHHGIVLAARMGKRFAEKELKAALNTVKVEHILERYEIDHTPVDVLLICKVTKLVLGRPWLTLCIDRKSRMIVGFYISFHTPSAYSVLYCLRMAMLPKDHILKRFGIVGRWPARGIPDLVVSDNGMELHAIAVEVVTYQMGIEHQYCGVADPEMKGAIEREFRTVSVDLFHQLPGTVFSNPLMRAQYPAEKLACLDLDKFVEIFVRWIVTVYHEQPHRGLNGFTPLQAWDSGEANRQIELPAYPEQLETIVAISATRTVFHYGIQLDNLFYNSDQLQSLLDAAEDKKMIVAVRSHEHDVGFVHVQDPESREFFKVPAVNQDYAAGVNRHVHLLVCAEARARFGDSWRDDQLLEAKATIQAIVDAAIRDKKMSNRKSAAVMGASDSESIISQNEAELAEEVEVAQKPIVLDAPSPTPAQGPDVVEDDLPDLVSCEISAA